jgi:hypothetical protein
LELVRRAGCDLIAAGQTPARQDEPSEQRDFFDLQRHDALRGEIELGDPEAALARLFVAKLGAELGVSAELVAVA